MEKYNGWTNRETWEVWTILSNSQTCYLICLGKSADYLQEQFGKGTENVNWQEISDAFNND
jgi:hypothetical protein